MRIIMPENPIKKAHTVSVHDIDRPQTIEIKYENSSVTDELWQAIPSCEHEIQTQRSGGIKCIKCGGWCAF